MTKKDKFNFFGGLLIGVFMSTTIIGSCSNTNPQYTGSGRIKIIDHYSVPEGDFGTYQIIEVDGILYISSIKGGITPLIKQ